MEVNSILAAENPTATPARRTDDEKSAAEEEEDLSFMKIVRGRHKWEVLDFETGLQHLTQETMLIVCFIFIRYFVNHLVVDYYHFMLRF